MVQVRVLAVNKECVRSPDAREELRRNTRRIFQDISAYVMIFHDISGCFRIFQDKRGTKEEYKDDISEYFRIFLLNFLSIEHKEEIIILNKYEYK